MKKKEIILSIISIMFVMIISVGCVDATTKTRNVTVYTTSDTSGILICINEHKATYNGSSTKGTVTNKFLLTGASQSIKISDGKKYSKATITAKLGNAKQTKTSKITF